MWANYQLDLLCFHFYPYFAARPAAWDEQVRVRNISIKYSDSTQKSTRRTRLIQPECDYFFEFSLNGRNMRDNWDGHFPPVLPKTPIPLNIHARRDEQGRAIIFSIIFLDSSSKIGLKTRAARRVLVYFILTA